MSAFETICQRCGDGFISTSQVRVKKDWRSDDEERVEEPKHLYCPDCRVDIDAEAEEI